MSRWLSVPLAMAICASWVVPISADEETVHRPRRVIQIQLEDEAISPPVARFIDRAIRHAEAEQADCLVLVLDTPGGLVDSTRDVVKSILRSRVPIVVFVAPSGARAASAGVFITLASHVAAMAPGTNIGAAHPVQIGGLPGSPGPTQKDEKKNDKTANTPASPLNEKIANDTAAWARSLAELRGRNADWASRAVKESISVSASEAVEVKAVDLLADDVADLLRKLDGREVAVDQATVRLRTAGAERVLVEMWWGEQLLTALANPNVAFLLLLFGFYGILFELNTPGWGVGGTLGIICLVLGFFAMSVLPINYVGLVLIVLALSLFVAEAFVTSFGFLTIGGVTCLVLGGLMLVESPLGFQRVSLWVVIPVALATAVITVFLAGSIVKSHRARTVTGDDALRDQPAIAIEDFGAIEDRYAGMVQTHGELWKALSPTPVAKGQQLRVHKRQGLTLLVDVPDREHGPPKTNETTSVATTQ